jgi:hypothetical protein
VILLVIAAIGGIGYYFAISPTNSPTVAGQQTGTQLFSPPVCTNTPSAQVCVSDRNYSAPVNTMFNFSVSTIYAGNCQFSQGYAQWSCPANIEFNSSNLKQNVINPALNLTAQKSDAVYFNGTEFSTLVRTQSYFIVNGTKESNQTSYSLQIYAEGTVRLLSGSIFAWINRSEIELIPYTSLIENSITLNPISGTTTATLAGLSYSCLPNESLCVSTPVAVATDLTLPGTTLESASSLAPFTFTGVTTESGTTCGEIVVSCASMSLTSISLYSGTPASASNATTCSGSNAALAFYNLEAPTYITSISITGPQGSVSSFYSETASSCTSQAVPFSASAFPVDSGSTSVSVYFGTNLVSGQTYDYAINLANGQSYSGTLVAQ